MLENNAGQADSALECSGLAVSLRGGCGEVIACLFPSKEIGETRRASEGAPGSGPGVVGFLAETRREAMCCPDCGFG